LYLTVENPVMKQIFTAFFSIALCIFLTSCEDHYGICNISRAVSLQGKFYNIAGSIETPVNVPSLTMKFLNGTGFLYNQQANAAAFAVPVSPIEDTMNYYISLSNALTPDTLSIVYSSRAYAISEECGTISVFRLLEAYSTRNTIDSVKILADSVTNMSGQNLKIYF
jgi:hypothetical protein